MSGDFAASGVRTPGNLISSKAVLLCLKKIVQQKFELDIHMYFYDDTPGTIASYVELPPFSMPLKIAPQKCEHYGVDNHGIRFLSNASKFYAWKKCQKWMSRGISACDPDTPAYAPEKIVPKKYKALNLW